MAGNNKKKNCSVKVGNILFSKKWILLLTLVLLALVIFQTYTMVSITGMASASGTISMCIIGPPNITSIPDQNATVGRLFSYQVNCTSVCNETLNFYHLTIPTLDSFAINASTGEVNFTPQSGEEGSYTAYVYCDKFAFDADSESFTLTVNGECDGPGIIQGVLADNNNDIELNWTNVTDALSYTIYHSTNISEIMTLDIDSIPGTVTKIENITDLNWTDTAANLTDKRYYHVSAQKSGIECLSSDTAIGKFTYQYDTPNSDVYGTLASNRIALYLNLTYDSETFLQEIPGALNPTLSRLDKSNSSGEYLTTHVRGLADGNIFDLEFGTAYQITLDEGFNQTVVGKIYNPPYTLQYQVPSSDTYGSLATNLYGVFDFQTNYTAETFLQEVPGALNPTISRLDKSNTSGEFLTTHVRGLADGNDFNMLIGTGYAITVDSDYNHTLCTNTTLCFE